MAPVVRPVVAGFVLPSKLLEWGAVVSEAGTHALPGGCLPVMFLVSTMSKE